ncbi:hypothetical protein E2P81_ATG03009 [Venturia nashicola]|uniref:Uncharacterized protein n=1 Tax=Venturia nashicola TaxID=86259 RepID=A0A4Z1P3R5_9PEZI|nr:hypothetical protein E6O75_ATG03073 [Venturia nashicola]TLD36120.1 hypothetical protein E2P81_ATG03009 [Venturia nashicola]
MYRSLTSTKSFNALRKRAEQAEQTQQTHRLAEDYYRSYAGQYFQMKNMRQKLAHDGGNGLPYQLFIAPRTVKPDTWFLDFERVDALIQEIVRLFPASPFAIGKITARLDKFDRGLKRIRDKLRLLAEAINDQIQAAASEPLHLKHGILEHFRTGVHGIEDKGVPVDGMYRNSVDCIP